MASTISCDLAILGGGLAGGLAAMAIRARHPTLDLCLVESSNRIGGNHLWSFFGSDVSADDRPLVAPLVAHAWPGYQVAFPAHRRSIAQPYYSIESIRLDAEVRRILPAHAVMTGRRVLAASPTAAVLSDGDRIEARAVIDARGTGDLSLLELGWQKFVGREIKLDAPHELDTPIVMDATVAQIDGYRFMYALPFKPKRVFLEDTYYSDTPDLDAATLRERIDAYATARGWVTRRVDREEAGVLPVAMGGDFEEYWRSGGNRVAKIGMRAGLFHPTTGYSLPDAVRTAAMLANRRDFSADGLHDATHALARRSWRRRGFYRMLDTMLFKAAEPADRYRVLERFYRLQPGLIGRFYAGTSTVSDKARILTGRPPVPIMRAVRALTGFGAGARA
ncbi:lycopene beta-cyclase [Sphingomonas gellani]|uniref:Lycopene beta-cyclase n=1 Tax=Sphingomonas gellani TaxID=1166340 RepID=A0A1H8HL57_9SPHN|nr:lycopene beta-cyclase CrtY [Sphingomonas gellani]SEN56891.1 lycopene beta-cyclase [Sphingomonas gellani]